MQSPIQAVKIIVPSKLSVRLHRPTVMLLEREMKRREGVGELLGRGTLSALINHCIAQTLDPSLGRGAANGNGRR